MAINANTNFRVVLVTANALPTTKTEGTIYVWRDGIYLGTSADDVTMLGQIENVASLESVTNPVAERYYVNTSDGSINRWTGTVWQQLGGSDSFVAQNFSITGKATAAAQLFDGTAAIALNVTSLDATGLSGDIPSSVTATTQSANDNSTKIATTAYADSAATNAASSAVSNVYTKTEVDAKVASVYRVKGSVDQVASDASHTGLDDPHANTEDAGTYTPVEGDVWNVLATGDNYVWVNGTPAGDWDKLSATVDLTGLVTLDTAQTISGAKTFSTTITGDVSGNAGTATKLANARTINISNDGITGTAQNFDGSENITIPITFTTQSSGDNSTKPATTAYVDSAVSGAVVKWSVIG